MSAEDERRPLLENADTPAEQQEQQAAGSLQPKVRVVIPALFLCSFLAAFDVGVIYCKYLIVR
jgi:hypothetical protein